MHDTVDADTVCKLLDLKKEIPQSRTESNPAALSCRGKKTYFTLAEAQKGLALMVRASHWKSDRGSRMRCYRCRYCGNYHFGNSAS